MSNLIEAPQLTTPATLDRHLLPDYDANGSDLYVETFEPDDMVMLRERIAHNKERLDVAEALIVAEETLLQIMTEFFEDGEDFRIHEDRELQDFVKDCMRQEVFAKLGDGANVPTISDGWLNTRLNHVQGFPPYSYRDDSPELEERYSSVGFEVAESVPTTEAIRAVATVNDVLATRNIDPASDPTTKEWLLRKAASRHKV